MPMVGTSIFLSVTTPSLQHRHSAASAGLLLPQGYENAPGSLTVLPAYVFKSTGKWLLVSLAIWNAVR